MQRTVLMVPGINNSGPDHWQSRWQASHPSFQRIEVTDWRHPTCTAWGEAIDAALQSIVHPVVIVAHSLGCLGVVHWSRRVHPARVAAVLLVSVPDPDGPAFPVEATGFGNLPMQRLPFNSIVVSSCDDPYGTPDHARRCASAWGSRFVEIGAAGHINADSDLGDWPVGWELLRSL